MARVDSSLVSLPEPHSDHRGSIQDLALLEGGHFQVQVITSRAGSTRGKHRHRRGWHYCYLVSGLLDYYADDRWPPERFGPGEMFYSPPSVAHAMRFLEDSVMVVIADRRRDQAEYEADLEHVEITGVP